MEQQWVKKVDKDYKVDLNKFLSSKSNAEIDRLIASVQRQLGKTTCGKLPQVSVVVSVGSAVLIGTETTEEDDCLIPGHRSQ